MTGRFSFPIFVDVLDRRVLVAGDGHEAAAKARALADLGADVARWVPTDGPFDPASLDGVLLAIVGTGERVLDHRIAGICRERGVLVNTVDDIPWCDWSAPAILRRGELTVAVGSGGIAPALAAQVRDLIGDELVGPEYAELLQLFAELRPRITQSGRPFRERRRLWHALVDSDAIQLLGLGRRDDAQALVDALVRTWEQQAA